MNVLVVQPRLHLALEITRDHLWRLQIEHAAGGEATHQRLLDSARIDARAFGKEHRLGCAELVDDRADLVARLGHLTGTVWPDVDDARRITREDRRGSVEGVSRPADHDRERARLRGSAAARAPRLEP